MVSTRLAATCPATGFGARERRHRVDPGKLLDLIQRIRASSQAEPPSLTNTKPKPLAEAG